MSEVRAALEGVVDDVERHVRRLIDETMLGAAPTAYREKLLQAAREGARLLARAGAGENVVVELKIVGARMALWGWAGAEHARQAMVAAWKAWLTAAVEALAEGAQAVLELGLRALIDSGLESLDL